METTDRFRKICGTNLGKENSMFISLVTALVYLFAIWMAVTGFVFFVIDGTVSAAILAGSGIIAACVHHCAARR